MTWEIRQGDCVEQLRDLPDESVQCCVTSPPYWGLRDYGSEAQIGLESSPDAFVAALVAAFDEVRRVLRSDGTLWLNLGDSYATGAGAAGNSPGGGKQGARWLGSQDPHRQGRPGGAKGVGPRTQPNRLPIKGLKPKDLCGIPWRAAFALQAAGWYLRSDVIWSKPNPMPESVTDRPTKSHEYLFLLTKSRRYFYDQEATRRPDKGTDHARTVLGGQPSLEPSGGIKPPHRGLRTPEGRDGRGANLRTVWEVATQPYPGAHFATFPPKLIEPCILAGAPGGALVLDPFAGAGTTGLVASRLDRDFIGIELNPDYCELARRRIRDDAPLLNGHAEVMAA